MKPSSKEADVKHDEIIRILGEEKIEKLYSLLGSQKFSVAAVMNFIKKKKIISYIKTGMPFGKIASQTGTTKMTVYRYLKNVKRK